MKDVTITRNDINDGKLYVAKIYVEDSVSGELEIGGVMCRRLGYLKNGETATFSVDYAEQKLFTVFSEMSKVDEYNYITLPYGFEDINLTANYKDGLLLFENQENHPIGAKGKGGFWKAFGQRALGRIIGIVIVAAVVAIIANVKEAGWFAKDRDITVGDFSITLTHDFEEGELFDDWYAFIESDFAQVYAYRQPFIIEDYDISEVTVEDYGALLESLDYFGEKYSKHTTPDGIIYYEYIYVADNGEECADYLFVIKGSDAFWEVEFLCLDEKGDKLEERFIEWAESVRVK